MSDPIDDIFGEPALLQGEDRERYMRLYAAVEADIQPKNFFDRLHVREQTDKIWEELRIKRSSAALIDSALVSALSNLLRPVLPQEESQESFLAVLTYSEPPISPASKAAYEYYGP